MDQTDLSRADGWRMKLGYVNPTVVDYPNHFSEYLVDGAKVVAVSSGATTLSADNMEMARERRMQAAITLDDWGVDCIIAGGGPVTTIEGAEAERALVEEIQAAVGVPFTTSVESQIEALNAVGADTLLAVTPFEAERDAETRAYLEERGFTVADIGGPSIEKNSHIRALHPSTAYQHAKRMAREATDEFDTIYVGCAPFGRLAYVERLERDTGYPVVMSSQAQIWKAYQLCGVSPDPTGLGRLFATAG